MRRRYLLEKRPNLYSCILLLPLVDPEATEAEAKVLGQKLGHSQKLGPLPRMYSSPSLIAPSMTVEKKDDGSLVRIFAPSNERGVVNEYIQVPVDCKIDVERSTLTLHGDHLSARLAFTEASAGFDARIRTFKLIARTYFFSSS